MKTLRNLVRIQLLAIGDMAFAIEKDLRVKRKRVSQTAKDVIHRVPAFLDPENYDVKL